MEVGWEGVGVRRSMATNVLFHSLHMTSWEGERFSWNYIGSLFFSGLSVKLHSSRFLYTAKERSKEKEVFTNLLISWKGKKKEERMSFKSHWMRNHVFSDMIRTFSYEKGFETYLSLAVLRRNSFSRLGRDTWASSTITLFRKSVFSIDDCKIVSLSVKKKKNSRFGKISSENLSSQMVGEKGTTYFRV